MNKLKSSNLSRILFLGLMPMFLFLSNAEAQKLPRKKSKSTAVSAENQAPTAEPTSNAYVFNALGTATPTTSETRPPMQFKVPTTDKEIADQTNANPVENIKNDQLFVTYVGYPRYQLKLAANPTSTGFKQEYQGLPLNFSSNSNSGFNLLGRLQVNPETAYELDYTRSEYGVKAKPNVGIFDVVESKATIDTIMASANFCNIGSNARNKLCGGVVLGLDAYPSLNFKTNTNVEITPIKDTGVGLKVNYQYSALPNVNILANASYFYGLKIGQDSNLAVKNNSKIYASSGVEYLRSNLDSIIALVAYEGRDAEVEGLNGSNLDTWKTKATSVSLNIGYQWTWQAKPAGM